MTDWSALSWDEVRDAVAARPFALLPFGAIEEHGPHLPLGTDSYLADQLATRIAERAELLRLPTMPYGQVWSLGRFPGTLSVRDETLVALIADLADGLERSAVRGLVMFSAHLGNAAALRAASRRLEEAGSLPAIALTYPGLREIAAQVRESPESHPSIVHADELETSLMLALAPERVEMSRAVAEYPDYPAHFDATPMRWDTLSRSGVFGDPTTASAAKGERIAEHVIDTAVSLIAAWREGIER
jgi:creatinine amidohydrolase